MTWTYNTALNEPRNQLRLAMGDTDENDQILQDEELQYLIDTYGTVSAAAAPTAEVIAAKFARKVSKTIGRLRLEAQQMFDHYKQLAKDIRDGNISPGTGTAFVAPYAGGITESDKLIDEQNSDLVKPFFRREMHDNPRGETGLDEDDC